MKRKLLYFNILFASLLLTLGCNQQSDIDISNTLRITEDYFRKSDGISTTAASNDKKDIKFRLMVENNPSQEEATAIFNKILDNLKKNSQNPKLWNYYNGYFDIKSYNNGVIYKATKLIGEDLKIVPK